MTIKELIDIVDGIKPNQYGIEEKVRWLSFVEHTIINDVIMAYEGYEGQYDDFEGYSPDKLDVQLIVRPPHDRLYEAYLKMKIDEENGETARYNNSATMYNTYLMEYKKWYNKNRMVNCSANRRTSPCTPPTRPPQIEVIGADALKQIEENEESILKLRQALNNEVVKGENETKERKSADAIERAERLREIAVERARINAFVTLKEGSTTGDAELNDARTDFEGKTWNNVGTHIREVANNLSEQIEMVYDATVTTEKSNNRFDGKYVAGKNLDRDGGISDIEGRDVSEKQYGFEVGKTYYAYCTEDGGIRASTNVVRVAFFDANDSMISYEEIVPKFTVPDNTKYLLICMVSNVFNRDLAFVESSKPIPFDEYYVRYNPKRDENLYAIVDGIDKPWKGKKIAWFGTSIPAGVINAGDSSRSTSYPVMLGEKLGATVFNEAVGSSAMRIGMHGSIAENDANGYAGVPATCCLFSLSGTVDEKKEIINNWATWKKRFKYGTDVIDSIIASNTVQKQIYDRSYEVKLAKYLKGGSVGECDLYVLDHGYNDGGNGNGFDYSDLNDIPSDATDRTYYIGAMNFIISKIKESNINASICIVSHYNDEGAFHDLVEAQRKVADYWNIPFIRICDRLGFSTSASVTINGVAKTMKDWWMPDGIHPSSDETGKASMHYADVLYPLIRDVR